MPEFNPPKYKRGDPWKADDVNALIDEVKNLGRVRGSKGIQVRRSSGGLQIGSSPEANRYLAVAAGAGISARSGSTPGGGQCDLMWVDPSGAIAGLGITIDVVNPSAQGTGIAAGVYCWVEKDVFGTWFVAPLECSP